MSFETALGSWRPPGRPWPGDRARHPTARSACDQEPRRAGAAVRQPYVHHWPAGRATAAPHPRCRGTARRTTAWLRARASLRRQRNARRTVGPAVAEIRVLVDVRLIHIDQEVLIALGAVQQALELLDERLPPLRVSSAQQLLGFLPRQLEAVQGRADRL